MLNLVAHVNKYLPKQIGRAGIKRFGAVGYGVEALEQLNAGDEVVKIPWEVAQFLSADRAWAELQEQSFIPPLLRFTKNLPLNQLQEPQLVGGILLSMLLLRERASGESLHVRSIPDDLNVPIFWDQQQISELQSSPLVGVIQQRRGLIANIYEEVLRPCCPEVSPANFAW